MTTATGSDAGPASSEAAGTDDAHQPGSTGSDGGEAGSPTDPPADAAVVGESTAEGGTGRGDTPDAGRVRRTRRWRGIGGAGLLALGVGVLLGRPGPLLVAACCLGLAGYARLRDPPAATVAVERTVTPTDPDPGEDVAVTVTVENTGDGWLPDLRVSDGVPTDTRVVGGSAHHATALAPGDTATYTYTVAGRRGSLRWRAPTVRMRDLAGGSERESVATHDQTTVTCVPDLPADPPSIPLRAGASQYTGRFAADEGGQGVEFYSTRAYQHGDPLKRVDWKRTAKTGDLTTVEYRVDRSVTVVLLVDAREAARLAPTADAAESALDRSVEAAGTAYAGLTAAEHAAGVAGLGPDPCWLAPGNGTEHRRRVQELLGSHPLFSPGAPAETTDVYAVTRYVETRLPPDAQVILFSPLCDDLVAEAAVRLDAAGYPTTVVSPDPTDRSTPGHRVAAIRRALRVADLRGRDIPVVDWDWDESFERALAEHRRRRR